MADEVRFDAQGALVIPAGRLGRLAGLQAGLLRLEPLGDDLLLGAEPQPGQRPRPMLYGDLRLFSVAEVLALISSMRKDGLLSLLLPQARKTIALGGGEVIHASSTVADDRLGEVMWRRGRLSLEQLSRVQEAVRPGKRFGALLVEEGLLTPRELYDCLKEQVVDIVQGSFAIRRGEFLFFEGATGIKNAVRLEVTTHELIREGVKRLQELDRLEVQFADRQALLVARPALVDVPLGAHERHLLALADGRRSVGEILAASHLGEVEALRALAHLIGQGLAEQRDRTRAERSEVGALADVLSGQARMLRRIHQTLVAHAPGCEARLSQYLQSPPARHRPVFVGVGFDADGRLDVERLAENARGLDAGRARELALEALRDVYDYAVFQAMDVLDEEECEALMERLEQMRASLGQAKEGT
ncbi:MAG TPA: DUF4388 domain-containing protein [Myxococcota bacterium]|nr:DUF4388 domain-containing protein [Myxococcota bacterium]HRY94411.1 DUF4388 domain-containing protein [Myxococcota bacterium]HSA22798.1 DUF4388 domain-containing protein [Myxococcota bacterium]